MDNREIIVDSSGRVCMITINRIASINGFEPIFTGE